MFTHTKQQNPTTVKLNLAQNLIVASLTAKSSVQITAMIQSDSTLTEWLYQLIENDTFTTVFPDFDYFYDRLQMVGVELLDDCINPSSDFYRDNGFDDMDDGNSGYLSNPMNSFTEHFFQAKEIAKYFKTLKSSQKVKANSFDLILNELIYS